MTKLDRDPASGTALQEISFWLNLERALLRIQDIRESPDIALTLDILKHGKRFHATVSFDTDTGEFLLTFIWVEPRCLKGSKDTWVLLSTEKEFHGCKQIREQGSDWRKNNTRYHTMSLSIFLLYLTASTAWEHSFTKLLFPLKNLLLEDTLGHTLEFFSFETLTSKVSFEPWNTYSYVDYSLTHIVLRSRVIKHSVYSWEDIFLI